MLVGVVGGLDPEVFGERLSLSDGSADRPGDRCELPLFRSQRTVRPACGFSRLAVAPSVLPRGDALAVAEGDFRRQGAAASGFRAQCAPRFAPLDGGDRVVDVPVQSAVRRQGHIALVAGVILRLHGEGAGRQIDIGLVRLGADMDIDGGELY